MKKTIIPLVGLIVMQLCPQLNSQAQTLTRFQPNTWVGLAKPGMNAANAVYQLGTTTDPSNPNYTIINNNVTFPGNLNVNGIGLNAKDSLLYGITWENSGNLINSGNKLFRIGANGLSEDLGTLPLPGGNAPISFVNFTSGTMDKLGNYFYTAYGFNNSGFTKLMIASATGSKPNLLVSDIEAHICRLENVHQLVANPSGAAAAYPTNSYQIDLTNPIITASLQAFLDDVNDQYPQVYNADGGLQDIDLHPITGLMYGYITYPDNNGAIVGRPILFTSPIANQTNVVTIGSQVNSQPGQELAGLTFGNAGNLYALFTSGNYTEVDLNNGSLLTPTALGSFSTSNGNLRGDLARAFAPEIPTPVNISSFKAFKNGSTVQLSWTVAHEQEMNGYQIEKSLDQKNWESIGFQNAIGNTTETTALTYQFKDLRPGLGLNFYRLKKIDQNENATYSAIAKVDFSEGTHVTLFPNPTKGQFYLNISKDQVKSLEIFDLSGRLMLKVTQNNSADISNLPIGRYFVELTTNDEQKSGFSIQKN